MFPTWKENRWFAFWVSVFLICLSAFVGLKAWNAYTEHREIGRALKTRDTITIQGESRVSGKPTLAQISVGLSLEGKDVPSLQNQSAEKVNAITTAVKGLGVQEADIQTSNYSISPKYEYKDGVQNVIGYAVSQNVTLKVRDLAKIGAVIAKAGELGSNQIGGVTFTIDDPSDLEQRAREKALADARVKADELAKALGVKIVRVVTFSESSSPVNPPTPFLYRSELALSASAIPEIQAGSLDVTSRVSVTFEIQ